MKDWTDRQGVLDLVGKTFRDAQARGATLQEYSGRGMFGRSCVAMAGLNEPELRVWIAGVIGGTLVYDLLEQARTEVNREESEFLETEACNVNGAIMALLHWKMDSFGHGVIYYWPDVPFSVMKEEDEG